MTVRKFEVRGIDKNGDIWVVASDIKETAYAIAERFRREGYTSVEVTEK